jgi:hypothetical protein
VDTTDGLNILKNRWCKDGSIIIIIITTTIIIIGAKFTWMLYVWSGL